MELLTDSGQFLLYEERISIKSHTVCGIHSYSAAQEHTIPTRTILHSPVIFDSSKRTK